MFILVLIIILGIAGYYFSEKVLNIEMMVPEKNYAENITDCEVVDEEEYKNMKYNEETIQSNYDYPIKLKIYKTAEESSKYIIFSHGVTNTELEAVKFFKFFIKQGYNCITYNHRRHGETSGRYTTYGWTEKYDLRKVVDFTRSNLKAETIGLHGISMGAAIILQYGEIYQNDVDFFISDCAFSDFYDQLAFRLRVEYKLPAFPIINVAGVFTKIRAGFYIGQIAPRESIKKIEKPVLIVHNKDDKYIKVEMADELYRNKLKGKKKLMILNEGDHAQSYQKNQAEYESGVIEFLNQL